jgi:putative component of toxin-antitoxin plasmid stabilization module
MQSTLSLTLMLLIFLLPPSVSAADFKISLLPPDPGGANEVTGLARYEIFQTINGSESLISRLDSHTGDCKPCSRGISFNCGKGDNAVRNGTDACRKLVANGIGFRIYFENDGPTVRVKNGTGMTLSRTEAAGDSVLRDGLPANFLLTRDSDASGNSIRLKVTLLTRRARQENPSGILLFARDLPGSFAKICQENAGVLVTSMAMLDPQTTAYRPVSAPAKVSFQKAETWLAAPHDGIATYLVQIAMSDGWECDYQVDMAMHEGRDDSPHICGLSAVRFRMCSR